MAEHLLPDFKINKNEPENGIRELLKKIKSHWRQEEIQIEALSGGYSSKIFKCYIPSEPEDAVTMRIRFVFDNIEGFQNFQNKTEPIAIQYLSQVGHFPKVYAIFANGYCYQFVKGKAIVNVRTKVGIMTEKMLKSIAEEMVYIHNVKLNGVDYNTDESLKKVDMLTSAGPVKVKHDRAPSKETLLREINFMKEFIISLKLPLVLCHGDPQPGNFVWNDENDKITFIDWEGTGIGYRHVEIAQFILALRVFFSCSKDGELVLPEDYETKLVKYYFIELCKVQKREFTDEEYQNFKEIVRKCEICPSLMFFAVSLLLPEISTEFYGDSMKFVDFMLDEYLNLKEKILGRRKLEADL